MLLVEREDDKIRSGGFGLGYVEGPFNGVVSPTDDRPPRTTALLKVCYVVFIIYVNIIVIPHFFMFSPLLSYPSLRLPQSLFL